LERQKGFIVKEVVPPELRPNMEGIQAWDDWDVDQDRWEFEAYKYASSEN